MNKMLKDHRTREENTSLSFHKKLGPRLAHILKHVTLHLHLYQYVEPSRFDFYSNGILSFKCGRLF